MLRASKTDSAYFTANETGGPVTGGSARPMLFRRYDAAVTRGNAVDENEGNPAKPNCAFVRQTNGARAAHSAPGGCFT